MKALEPKWITARQIEAARVSLSRFIRKKGKMWTRIFPDKAITKHPAETRMGKGKGAPDHWVCVVKPGRILFEIEGTELEETKRKISQKMKGIKKTEETKNKISKSMKRYWETIPN